MTHIPFTSNTHCNFDDCGKELLGSKLTAEPIGNFIICIICYLTKVIEDKEKFIKIRDKHNIKELEAKLAELKNRGKEE